jgi:hypothetical protein
MVMLCALKFGAPRHIEAAAARRYEIRKLNSKGFYTEIGDGEVEIGAARLLGKMATKRWTQASWNKTSYNLLGS